MNFSLPSSRAVLAGFILVAVLAGGVLAWETRSLTIRVAEDRARQRQSVSYESYRSERLKRTVVLRASPSSFERRLGYADLEPFVQIAPGDCRVDPFFSRQVSDALEGGGVVFRPQLDVSDFEAFRKADPQSVRYVRKGRGIQEKEFEYRLCQALRGDVDPAYVDVPLRNYAYDADTVRGLQSYVRLGGSSLQKYAKLPKASEINSLTLLGKLSGIPFARGEQVSVLRYFLDHGGADLLDSNTLVDGKILQAEGGGACLGNTVLFRALLDAGIDVPSRRSHNIYYQNIYGKKLIGLDATVYRDGEHMVDLVFSNDRSPSILIGARDGSGSISVDVYGAPDGRTVQISPVRLGDLSDMEWKRVVLDSSGAVLQEDSIRSSYTEVNDF